VKLLAAIGAFLTWQGVLGTVLLGSLVGSAVGIGLMLWAGAGRQTRVPFGPFLAAGAFVWWLLAVTGWGAYLGAARLMLGV